MPATGTDGTIDSGAASVMNPAPVTPAAPLDETIATSSSKICSSRLICTLHAWAMKSAANVM